MYIVINYAYDALYEILRLPDRRGVSDPEDTLGAEKI